MILFTFKFDFSRDGTLKYLSKCSEESKTKLQSYFPLTTIKLHFSGVMLKVHQTRSSLSFYARNISKGTSRKQNWACSTNSWNKHILISLSNREALTTRLPEIYQYQYSATKQLIQYKHYTLMLKRKITSIINDNNFKFYL